MSHPTPRIIIVPGWRNSGAEHWQSLWAQALPHAERVEQDDWLTPKREDWGAHPGAAAAVAARACHRGGAQPGLHHHRACVATGCSAYSKCVAGGAC